MPDREPKRKGAQARDACQDDHGFQWLRFETVHGEEKQDLLRVLERRTTNFSADAGEGDAIALCKAKLSFYQDTWLVILTDHRTAPETRSEFLCQVRKGDQATAEPFIAPLYRTAAPLYEFNAERQGLSLETKAQAADYLRFFLEAVEGDLGPFHLLEGEGDIPGYARDKGLVQAVKDRKEKPVALGLEERQGSFVTDLILVLYGNGLFRAKFRIRQDGAVEMIEEEPLGTFNIRPRDQGIRHFALLKGANISSRQFEKALLGDSPDAFLKLFREERTKIKGRVDLSGRRIAIPLRFPENNKVIFEGNVDFSKAVFDHPVTLRNCEVQRGSMTFRSARIEGDLDLQGARIVPPPLGSRDGVALNLERLSCKGNLEARDLRVEGERSGSVRMADAALTGDLRLEETKVGDRLDLQGMRIEGTLCLDGVRTGSNLNISYANAEHDISIDRARIGGHLLGRGLVAGYTVSLSGAEIKGSVRMVYASMSGLFFHLHETTRTRIGGNLVLSGLDCRGGHIELSGTRVEGHMVMISPKGLGSLYLCGTSLGRRPFARAVYCEILGGVVLANVEIGGNLNGEGLRVGSMKELPRASVDQGQFVLSNGSVKGDVLFFNENKSEKDDFLYFLALGNEVYKLYNWVHREPYTHEKKWKDIDEALDIDRHVVLDRSNVLEYLKFFAVHIRHSFGHYLIEGEEILDWVKRQAGSNSPQVFREPSCTEDHGTFIIRAQTIDEGGNLGESTIMIDPNAKMLDNDHVVVEATPSRAAPVYLPPGKIFEASQYFKGHDPEDANWEPIAPERLPDALAGAIRSAPGTVEAFQCELPFFRGGRLIAIRDALGKWQYSSVIFGNLSLSGLRVEGNIHLCNIQVMDDIRLEQVEVAGNIFFSPSNALGPHHRRHAVCSDLDFSLAQIGGNVELAGLRILKRGRHRGSMLGRGARIQGVLKLIEPGNASSNGEVPFAGGEVQGDLLLTGAEIDELIVGGLNFRGEGKQLVGLERVSVNFLDWCGEVQPNLQFKLRDFTVNTLSANTILKIDEILEEEEKSDFKRSTYASIERSLKNQGYEEKAEAIYKKMWTRINDQKVDRKSKGFIFRSFNWFRAQFGYGSRIAQRSILLLVLFALLSLLTFSNPNNVVPAESVPEASPDTVDEIPEEMVPHPEEWGLVGGFWFMLRYSVPIIPVDARSQWSPNPAEWYLMGVPLPSVSAQDYANFVEFTHWVIWSVLLVYFSGIVRRGEQYD